MKRILCLLLVLVPSLAGADKNWNAGKGTTWDCKKDPVVGINHGKGVYKFKGACQTLNVNGGKVKITAESFDVINVNGSKNDITVASVGTVNVTGSSNKVTWKAAKSGDAPTVNNIGKDNVVAQAGGAAPTTPPATTAAAPKPAPAATAGTVIDCAKTSAFSYAENDGTFTLQGSCDKIMLSGNNNKLKVESVNNLMLSGNENTVEATKVDKIATTGNDNKVTYKGPNTSTKTKVLNTGNGNKISTVK